MTGNRVHLFEFSHVNVTKPSDLPLRLRNLAATNMGSESSSSVALLFLSFSSKLDLDPQGLFT